VGKPDFLIFVKGRNVNNSAIVLPGNFDGAFLFFEFEDYFGDFNVQNAIADALQTKSCATAFVGGIKLLTRTVALPVILPPQFMGRSCHGR
jgi:hypothetical protein